MKEYIERYAALQDMWNALYALEDERENQHGLDLKERMSIQAGFEAGQQVIANMPAADVTEVCHGKWMEVEVTNGEDIETHFDITSMWCNKCHRYHATIFYFGNPTEMMHYCPNCGAKMDGGADDEI